MTHTVDEPAAQSTLPHQPLVSVVIPTFNRPDLVVEAVRSALAQTYRNLEVLVIIDHLDEPGQDASLATQEALSDIADQRLRVLRHENHLGNAAARNFGLDHAAGEWIALLDDDDLWMPEKTQRQLEVALAVTQAPATALPIVSCRFIARNDVAEFLWPRKLPDNDRHISEYLFCRSTAASGEGVVQTSTMLVPKTLFDQVRFDPDCKRFVDLDWVLRATQVTGSRVIFATPDEPLSIWRMEDRPRISNQGAWRDDLAWIEARKSIVSPRASAAFLLTLASLRAARQKDSKAWFSLLRHALGNARPSIAELAFHTGNFMFSERLKALLVRMTT